MASRIVVMIVSIALVCFGSLLAQSTLRGATPSSFEFALIGDLPYTPIEATTSARRLISDINSYGSIHFVVHDGDLKANKDASGHVVPCTEQLYQDRRKLFQQFTAPFIYLFGDNDWRDCGEDTPAAWAQSQLDALHLLRTIFAQDRYPPQLGLIRASSQLPEIVHWTVGGIKFVGLNVPGPDNNNRVTSEYVPREIANIAAVREAYDKAVNPNPGQDVRGIVIILQADPFNRSSLEDGTYTENSNLADLMTAIETGAQKIYPKPVLLVHGDSHVPIVDKPVPRHLNITRVSTFGTPLIHWIRVSVSSEDPSVFAIHLQMVKGN